MPSRVKSLHDVRVHEENEAAVCHDDEKSVKGDAGKRHLEIDLAALLDEMHAAPGNLELNYRNVTAIIPVLQALKDCRLQPDAPSGSAGTFASTRRAAKSTVYTPTGRPLLELEEWNDEILQTVSDMETLVADLLAVEKAKYVESKRQVLEHFFPKTGHCRAAILDGDVRTEDWATCDSTIACVFSRPADVSTTAPVPFAEVGFGGGPAKHHAKNEPKFVQLKLWLADSDAPKFEAAAGESIPSEGEEGHSDSSGDDDFLNFAVSMYEYETCGRPGARTSAKSYLVTNWYLMSPGFFAAFKGDQLQIGFGPITAKLRIADDHKRGELERFLTLAQELTAQRATFARALQPGKRGAVSVCDHLTSHGIPAKCTSEKAGTDFPIGWDTIGSVNALRPLHCRHRTHE
eukprot:g16178.t1